MTNYSIGGSSGTTGLTAKTTPVAADLLLIVDSADTSTPPAGSAGSDKKITFANLTASLLPLAGGTMTGAIAMGSHKITGLTNGSSAQDAAAFGQTPAGGTTVTVAQGGTGDTSLTAYAVLAGGTTSTGALQQVSGVGSSGQVLTSNGAAALPTWQPSSSGFSNPMTTLGDIIYENATPAPARLAGNTTSALNVLTQTGTGSASAAPAWETPDTAGLVAKAGTQTISGAKTFTSPPLVEITSGTAMTISSDGTATSGGAITFDCESEHLGFIAIYSSTLASACYMVPDVITTHYAPGFGLISATGFGIIGSTFSTGACAFAVVNFNQFSYGIGQATFTCLDNDVVTTFNNTLDDGSGNMALAGGLTEKLRAITSSATLTATDSAVLLNAATLTATLPTAVGITGRSYTVKVVASSTGTVATTSSQTIDGSTTYSLSAIHKYVTVVSDGANWQIVANN